MNRTLTAGIACAALLLAACGDDDDTADAGADTTEAPSGSASSSADDAPERIVALGPTGTEILFAIGAGEQVVAVDDQSDFPEGVPTTDLSSYEPNVEAVTTYEPDLVVITGDVPEDAVSGLEAVGIEVLHLDAPTEIDEVYEQFTEIGEATGHEEEAEDLVEEVRSGLDELVAQVPEREEAPTYYHELDPTLYSVTSSTFIGQIYELAGLENVADSADPDGELGGYPQLSPEVIVAADPDFVFLADAECCGEDATTFAARPGFADLTAVRDGNVVQLDEDIVSRWGPRIVDFLELVVQATSS